MATPRCSAGYSSDTAEKTLEWMNAIVNFIRPFRSLIDAHVVNFFKDKLWETVNEDWMTCLRKEPVVNLLGIPSGLVMDHWPTSLQEFILTIKSLVISREQEPLTKMFSGFYMASLDNVLAQGMNEKKKHEVELLCAVIKSIACDVGAKKIIDVGAGQGYMAQVLSFEYQLPVIAIDASFHHSSVTSKRADRIKKYYMSKLRKSQNELRAEDIHLNIPQAVTCRVLTSSALSALSMSTSQNKFWEEINLERYVSSEDLELDTGTPSLYSQHDHIPLVLAGLHACGDLSVNMLRAFVECEQVKALVCVGCCYNLLSEEGTDQSSFPYGFPVSKGAAKSRGFALTKNARDLACQSADRWRNLSNDGAVQNFDVHIFRAAFQMVLEKYYPNVLSSNPSIGRQGKALRRQQRQRELNMRHNVGESFQITSGNGKGSDLKMPEHAITNSLERDGDNFVTQGRCSRDCVLFCCCGSEDQASNIAERCDKYSHFEEFSVSALGRLGFKAACDIDFISVWKMVQPSVELVGPYWSLRASFGPLLETYVLLDRLLFLQEQGKSVDAMMFPIFDPIISPRNIVIIARK